MAVRHELEAGRKPDVFNCKTEVKARAAAKPEAIQIAINEKEKLWESVNMDGFLKYMRISANDL